MIAEIHSKISSSGSNLSNRLEDQLTGDFFGDIRAPCVSPILGTFSDFAPCRSAAHNV
ncbi:hypothetical protein ACM1RC_28260 [Paenibacillus azoreducens]|uniref:hypothetical protein n=1 Tax=Paenibacillus azoreducens TaxID=116718 RepID=UPI0039F59B6C